MELVFCPPCLSFVVSDIDLHERFAALLTSLQIDRFHRIAIIF